MHCIYCIVLLSKKTISVFFSSLSLPPSSSIPNISDEKKLGKMFPFLYHFSLSDISNLEASFGQWLVAVPDQVDPCWLQSPWALLRQVNLNDWHLASSFLSALLQVVEKDKGRIKNWLELTVSSMRPWIFHSLWLLDVWQMTVVLLFFGAVDVLAPFDLLCSNWTCLFF